MKSLGFDSIVNPIMLNTVGKVMTIKKGAQMKKIDLDEIIAKFKEYNFILEDNNERINKQQWKPKRKVKRIN